MLCKSCGDVLEDGNRYAYVMNSKTYRLNTCRPCKRTQALTVYYLRKQHPLPPAGTPCDCCGRIDKLNLDHEHSSQQWRGFLCRQCNLGIGQLGDSVEGVSRALAYLAAANKRESESAQRENQHHGVVALERTER